MSKLFAWFQLHPALAAAGVGLIIVVALCGGIGWAMWRAGVSPRPLWWFVGFLTIIAGPQALFHLHAANRSIPPTPQTITHPTTQPTPAPPTPLPDRAALFGADVDPALVRDARQVFPELLARAGAAELALFPTGASVLAAHFTTPTEAADALRAYLAFYRLGPVGGDLTTGIRLERPALRDRVLLRLHGGLLMVWSAPDDAQLAARVAASHLDAVSPAPPPASTASPSASPSGGTPAIDPRLKEPRYLALTAALLLAAVLWFFKGGSWAASVAPRPGVVAVSADVLAARLEAIEHSGAPMIVRRGASGTEWEVEWRYADARWLDHAQAHTLRKTHRLVLTLDEASHTLRVREFWGTFSASAGAEDARIEWQRASGIRFFEYQHERVIGLQFDAQGRPTASLSYAYTFDLQEMKQPLIEAVTGAGWTWRPVWFDAPPALRWLTE